MLTVQAPGAGKTFLGKLLGYTVKDRVSVTSVHLYDVHFFDMYVMNYSSSPHHTRCRMIRELQLTDFTKESTPKLFIVNDFEFVCLGFSLTF